MINQEAIAYLVGLGKEQVVLEAKNGGQYTPESMYRIYQPQAKPFTTHTLTSVVDYVKENVDVLGDIIIHIETPAEVNIMSKLNADRAREGYLFAKAILPSNIRFNDLMDTERFNIMLQSSFVDHLTNDNVNHRDLLLKVTGLVKQENIKQIGDDGVSQSATIKTGVASVGEVKVPNPVILAPYRTFPEIKQPASKFIFRMADGPKAALFEADGGMWKNEAILSIKEYLEKELLGIGNVHILA